MPEKLICAALLIDGRVVRILIDMGFVRKISGSKLTEVRDRLVDARVLLESDRLVGSVRMLCECVRECVIAVLIVDGFWGTDELENYIRFKNLYMEKNFGVGDVVCLSQIAQMESYLRQNDFYIQIKFDEVEGVDYGRYHVFSVSEVSDFFESVEKFVRSVERFCGE
jgi:hypothetical protein